MSGICGLVRLDGAPASVEQLAPVHRALAFRGPDGGGMWAGGPVALGFRLLATTPEALSERQPWRHEASDCVIVADARLDNRDELAASLGLQATGRGDGELILLAYFKWGDDAPLHLLGDFAFAIWDGRKQRLLAVRDPMGMRQLHYAYLPGKLLAFATDDHVLASHPQVDARLNELRVGDYIQDLEAADLTSTFYTGIKRLPSAHLMVLGEGRLLVRRYWRSEPQPICRRFNRRELAEELRELLDQSVKARLRSTGKVGSMLSGGLDSSSVVALAARALDRPLPTFSAVTRDPGCIETGMIRHMQSLENLLPHDLVAEESALFAAEVQRITVRTNPFGAYTVMIGCLYRQAQQEGCNVVLDGVTSDLLFGGSMAFIDLLRRGRWALAWHEIKREHAFYGSGPRPLSVLLRHGSAALTPFRVRSSAHFFRYARKKWLATDDLLRASAVRRLQIAERRLGYQQAMPTPSLSYQDYRAALIVNNDILIGREHYDRLSSNFGIEARDPFNDLRLVKFGLSLTPEALTYDGWTKHVLRQGMEYILPEPVRWRRSRHHVGYHFRNLAAQINMVAGKAAFVRQRSLLEKWIKPSVIEGALPGITQELDPSAESCIYLAQYLDDFELSRQAQSGSEARGTLPA